MTALDPDEIQRAIAGCEVARTALCLSYLPRIYALARRIAGDDDLARDAAQEAILRLLRGLSGLRDPAKLEGWVLTIAGNAARDALARSGREQGLAAEPPAPSAAEPEPERSRAIEHAVASLAAPERELFLLHTVEGVALRELAEAHDTTENAMKARVHRIRAKVRTRALACLDDGGRR